MGGRSKTAHWKENVEGYLFISPWLVGTILFTLGPVIASFALGFFRWDLFTSPHYIGTTNFVKLSHDPLFYKSILNTLYYTVVGVPLGLVVALLLAVLVDQKIRGITFFRTAFFLPNIVSGIAMMLVWKWLFDPNFGLINELLDVLRVTDVLRIAGIGRPQWLAAQNSAMPALILMSLWGVGGAMIVFLAGLQNVPRELMEAAEIDGATSFRAFRHVTLPLLTPTIFFLTVTGVIGALQSFNQAYIMTNGGPANATLFYCLYLFRNAFEMFNMGYACAMALLLFLVALAITWVQVRSSRKWVHYS